MNSQNICHFGKYESSDLICSRFVYETTDCQSEPRVSEEHFLHLVIRGEGCFVLHGERHPISRGALFYCRRGETFAVESGTELEYCYVSFRGRRADELIERIDAFAESPVCVPPDADALAEFWMDCIGRVRSDTADLLGEATLLYTFACLQPTPSESASLLSRITRETEQSFTDPRFSLSLLAHRLGYVPKYLSSYFKKHRGIAFTQYLRDLRIKHAIFLIEQGVHSVKNIAILSGFSDALYFSTVFKQSVGLSPRDYIQRIHE